MVSGATKITVKMASGEEFEAKMVGADPKTDLAVIKIKAPQGDLPYLKFGDSDKIASGGVGGGHRQSPRAWSRR